MKRFLIAALAMLAGVCVARAQQGPPAGAYGSGAGGSGGSGSGIPYGTGGGTAQAQTVTTTPNITALTTGTYVTWLPTAANTAAAPTLAAGTTAATAITKCGTVALVAGDLLSTVWAVAQYDGTEWVLQNPVQFGCSEGGLPTSGGTANAQTLTVSPVITAYITGAVFNFTPGVANTGATTVAVSGLGTKNVTKCGTTALVANDLTTTAIAIILYDGTEFQLLNPQATGCGGASGGTYGSAINPGITHIDEEFFWNIANVGTGAGLYGWTVNVIGAQSNCNSNGYVDPGATTVHDGEYQIVTDATAAHGCAAALGRSNASLNDPFVALDTTTNYDSIFIFKLSTTTTISALVGFVNTNNVQLPTNQIAVRFDNTGVTKCGATQTTACADTNFTFVTCKAAACQESTTNSIAATSANYVKVRIRSTVAGSWAFSICSGDGCTLGTETTLSNGSSQVPSVEMSPGFQITAGAASSVFLLCDKFEIVRNPDGR